MHTVPLTKDIPQSIDTLKQAGFDLRYEPDEDQEFIVKTSTGAAVWGSLDDDSVTLYEFNSFYTFSIDDIEAFAMLFDNLHRELDEDGFAAYDEALTEV